MSPRRRRRLGKASLDRRVLLDRRVFLDRRVLLDRRVFLDRRGVRVLRECQGRRVLLGLRALLGHRDRPDFDLPRRVVMPSAKFPAMRTNTSSMLTCLMQGAALSITTTADYHLHPLVAAPAKSS
jgi:hypothetical protein